MMKMPPMKGSSSSWRMMTATVADGAAEGERADVAHEDFGGVGVIPEKADGGADHGAAEDGELADHGHALQLEVVGEDDVAADVGEHGERAGGDDGAADGEAVEAVGEVDGVGGAHEHEDDEGDEGQKDEQGRDAEWSRARCQSRSGRQLLMKGTVSCVENMLNCGEHDERDGDCRRRR